MPDWINIEDKLPEDGQWVYAFLGEYHESPMKPKHEIVQFIKGKTSEDFIQNPSLSISEEDQWGNNLKPYNWKTGGPMRYFGQDVTHWKPLDEDPDYKHKYDLPDGEYELEDGILMTIKDKRPIFFMTKEEKEAEKELNKKIFSELTDLLFEDI